MVPTPRGTALCMACNNSASPGTCAKVPQGKDPRNVCKGTKDCGYDTCDGKGKCAKAEVGKECKRQCSGTNVVAYKCSANGLCTTKAYTGCKTYKCVTVSGKSQCGTSCTSSTAHCASTSVCDRSEAHMTGKGVCVDTSKVMVVAKATAGALAMAIASKGSHSHIRLPAGTYWETGLTINKGITVIGDGAVHIKSTASGSPLINITTGAVTLQGLTISGSKGKDGIKCKGNEAGAYTFWPVLYVVESTVENNAERGIKAEACHFKMRRSVVRNNTKGGVEVEKGGFFIVNNLIVKNGSPSGSAVGVELKPESSTAPAKVFSHNTVADNVFGNTGSGQAGIKCSIAINIYNSIFYNNTAGAYAGSDPCFYNNCALGSGQTSAVKSNILLNPQLEASYKLKNSSPCINAGDDNKIESKLDLASGDRKKGTKVDIGAYELK